jgi:acyl carrier protein
MAKTLDRVKKVTSEILKIDLQKIGDDSFFVKDLGAKSIQSIELIATLEEEFGVEMDEDDALAIKSVADAATFIDKLKKK